MVKWTALTASDGHRADAYVVHPVGKPRGGVVVLQEIFGVNAHIRAVADGYAAAGYLAVAPSTFSRVQVGVELGYGAQEMATGSALKAAVEALPAPGVLADVQAAVDLAAQAGKVGVVGYCWGGLLAWRSACLLRGLSAAVPYYGGGMTLPVERARAPRVPVLAHFAQTDHWIALDTVTAFAQAQPDVQVQLYAAQHGFNCDHRGAFDGTAAQLAHERTVAFFEAHLA